MCVRWIIIKILFQWFDFAFIPKSLEWLDIHNNKIDRIGNYYTLGSGFSLQTFDASFNKISELSDTTLLHGLKNIYLNNNKISKIAPETFKSLENLTRVEIQNNDLVTLTSEAVITSNTGNKIIIITSCLKLLRNSWDNLWTQVKTAGSKIISDSDCSVQPVWPANIQISQKYFNKYLMPFISGPRPWFECYKYETNLIFPTV